MPSPGRAFDRHPTAVELSEELHHRQPEAGAFELSRQTAIDLSERLEQEREALAEDADAGVASR